MGTQSTWGVPNKTLEGRAIMKIIILTAAFIAGALAAPEAKADADAWYGYYGRGYGYGGYYRPYRYYGGWYGKRSAGAEPEAEAAPDADADAWYGYYGYGYRPYGYGYHGYYRPYGYAY